MKHAIVCLSRGYPDVSGYDALINRNHCIYNTFYACLPDKERYDVIIFHEGNITDAHQQYIRSRQPDLPLVFKPVEFLNITATNCLCPPTPLSESFSIGYKNMCLFWSVRFFDFLKDYEYVIRIDEDCNLLKMRPSILSDYKKMGVCFSTPFFQERDLKDVTLGMESLFNSFMHDNGLPPVRKHVNRCPYTNVMIVNIPYFRGRSMMQRLLERIVESHCVFSNRWGDLAIWGYVLLYLIDKKCYIEDRAISYSHGSHGDKRINGPFFGIISRCKRLFRWLRPIP